MNRVLGRQLRRLGLDPDAPPADPETWAKFLDRIGAFYDDADRSRYLLERSLEISSREMQTVNEQIRDLARRETERREQISAHNFNQLPVAAWLEDFRGVVSRLDDLKATGVADLAQYLDANPEAVRDLVERVEVIDLNPVAVDLVEGIREDLLGRVDSASLSDDSLVAWRRQFEAMWDHRGRTEVEFTGERRDGSKFSAILHWSVAQVDGEFDYSRVLVVIIDITDRIEAEDKMRQLVVAKDEFLASVSHELRTPLTSVLGYSTVLLTEDLSPEERSSMLATVADQAADLSNIVEDLLVGARSELGQLDVEIEPIDLAEILGGCLRGYPSVEQVDGNFDGLWVMGDAGRLRQILRNLLTNAARYGGPKTVVWAAPVGDEVEMTVADSGPELDAGISGRVFERYYREGGERRPTGSVGIGLTIARELARLMGGDLAYRHDGTWSQFVLTLPRVRRLRAVS